MTRFPARLIFSLGLITAVGFGCKPEPMVTPSTSPPAVSATPEKKVANGKEEVKKPDEAAPASGEKKSEDAEKKTEPEEKKPADGAKPETTPEKKAD